MNTNENDLDVSVEPTDINSPSTDVVNPLVKEFTRFQRNKIKYLSLLGILSALAFVSVILFRIPIIPAVSFLKFEPKTVILTIGGFILGPIANLIMIFVSCSVELFISDTGLWGWIMNVLHALSFSFVAVMIYQYKKSFKTAILGLLIGSLFATLIMLLWNHFILPIYAGWPVSQVDALMVPALLPFNLIKNFLNMAFILLLYKPIINTLRKTNLFFGLIGNKVQERRDLNIALLVLSLLLLSTIVLILVIIFKFDIAKII